MSLLHQNAPFFGSGGSCRATPFVNFSWGSFVAGAAASSLLWGYYHRGGIIFGRLFRRRPAPSLPPPPGEDGSRREEGTTGGRGDPENVRVGRDGDEGQEDGGGGDEAAGPPSEVVDTTAASDGSRDHDYDESSRIRTGRQHHGALSATTVDEGEGDGDGDGIGGNWKRKNSLEYALSSLADLSHRIGEITVGGGGSGSGRGRGSVGSGGGGDRTNDGKPPKRQRWPWDKKRALPPPRPAAAAPDLPSSSSPPGESSGSAGGKQVRFSDAAVAVGGGDADTGAEPQVPPRRGREGHGHGGVVRSVDVAAVPGGGRGSSSPPQPRSSNLPLPQPSSTGTYLSSYSMPRTPSPDGHHRRNRLHDGGNDDGEADDDGYNGEWSVAGASAVRIDDNDQCGDLQPPIMPSIAALGAEDSSSAGAHSSPPSGGAPSLHHDKEGQPCIGSIFGLDVGGSLAKLVYFEESCPDQQEPYYSSGAMSMRSSMMIPSSAALAPPPPPRRAESSCASSSSSTNSIAGLSGLAGDDRDDDNGVASLRQDLYLRRMGRTTSCPPDGWAWAEARQGGEESYRSSSSAGGTKGPAHWNPPIDDAARGVVSRTNNRSVEGPSSDFGSSQQTSDRDVSSPPRRHRRQFSAADASSASAVFRRTASADSIHEEDDKSKGDLINDDGDDAEDGDGGSKIRKSVSMVNLFHSRDHSLALDRFYNFVRCLDWYERGAKEKRLSFHSRELNGEFHFIRFETRKMADAMDLIKSHNLHLNIREMGATGGGAHKFASDWETNLGIRMVKVEELDALVAGMQFVLADVVGECYTFKPERGCVDDAAAAAGQLDPTANGNGSGSTCDDAAVDVVKPNSDTNGKGNGRRPLDEWWWSRKVKRDMVHSGRTSGSYASNIYPYLLVTIGTGVSILRVDGVRRHERVSGSTIGGGTYWGLCRLLTDVENFKDALDLADRGDPAKVDMMVGDIYGEKSDALDKLGLSANVVASSFGKLVAKHDPASGITQEDLARALLMMVTNNIGQVAYLNAQLSGTPRIYFVGNFLRHNRISQQRLSFAINYWSKGKMEALFLEHEGYFGALGAFLLSQGIDSNKQRRRPRRKGDFSQFRCQGRGEVGGVPMGNGEDQKEREHGTHSDSSLSGDTSPYSPIQRTRSLSM